MKIINAQKQHIEWIRRTQAGNRRMEMLRPAIRVWAHYSRSAKGGAA